MHGRVVRILDLTESEIAAWEELSHDAVEPNPLMSPTCLVTAAQVYPDGDSKYLVIAEEDAVFFGCVSLQVATKRSDRRPLSYLERIFPTATTQVRRTRHNLTPLLREERGGEAMAAMLDAVRRTKVPCSLSLFRFETMNGEGPVATAVKEAAEQLSLSLYVLESWQRAVTTVQQEDDPAERERSAKSQRRRIKELQNPLQRHLGAAVQFNDRSDDPSAIEELFRLERTGYKFKQGVAVESFPGEPEWLRRYCSALCQRRELKLFTLEADGQVLALELYFASGTQLFFIHRTYDESESDYSPGGLLNLLFFDYFRQQSDYDFLDSCTKPTNAFTYRQYSGSQLTITPLVTVGGWTSRVALWCFGRLRDRILPMRSTSKATSSAG